MTSKDVVALILLALIGIAVGAAALWLILKYLPLAISIVLAVIIALVVVSAVATLVEFFAAAVSALYYSMTKKPEVAGRPIKLDDVKEMEKEKGKFKQEEE